MKKIISLLVMLVSFSPFLSAQKMAEHVVIISIDGFRPDFYLDPSWSTVNMRQLASKGVCAESVRGIFPSVTYPSHTTLITGCFPDKHGIYFNTAISPEGNPGGWIYQFSKIKTETLWEAARKAGITTASVSWPVSVDAPYIDYNIPEFWSFENPMDRREATRLHATPRGLFEETSKYATGEMEMNDFNLTSLSMDENLSRIAGYILRKYKPGLLTIHLPNTDGAEHKQGRTGELVSRTIAGADHAVSVIVDALTKAGIFEKTAIIITGDHGFVTTHTAIAPNVWLTEKGVIKGVAKKAYFFSAGGSAFLHLKDKNDSATLELIRSMLRTLPESQKEMFRVISRSEMDRFGADPDAVLALSANEGFCFSNKTDGPLLTAANGGKHGYFPDFPDISTGFIGYGPGFKQGVVIPAFGLEDVAPTAAYLLGIRMNKTDGTVLPGMMEQNGKK